jgi:hypothetical protein
MDRIREERPELIMDHHSSNPSEHVHLRVYCILKEGRRLIRESLDTIYGKDGWERYKHHHPAPEESYHTDALGREVDHRGRPIVKAPPAAPPASTGYAARWGEGGCHMEPSVMSVPYDGEPQARKADLVSTLEAGRHRTDKRESLLEAMRARRRGAGDCSADLPYPNLVALQKLSYMNRFAWLFQSQSSSASARSQVRIQ